MKIFKENGEKIRKICKVSGKSRKTLNILRGIFKQILKKPEVKFEEIG